MTFEQKGNRESRLEGESMWVISESDSCSLFFAYFMPNECVSR